MQWGANSPFWLFRWLLKKRIVFLWIGRLKGVLLEDSSFCYLTMWCFLSWSLQSTKDIFPKSIPSKVFYPGGHHFFLAILSCDVLLLWSRQTHKKPKSTLSKMFCWRTYRFFVSKIAVNQWWLRKKNKWCIFLFPKSQFQRHIPLRGPWVIEFRAKSTKPPAKHLWNDRFRKNVVLYFFSDHEEETSNGEIKKWCPPE